MNCGTVLDKLTFVAEGGLPAEELLAVRAHLAECEACGAAYRDMTRLVAELRSLPGPEPPPALRARIGSALDAAAAKERLEARSPWEVVGPYLAAAAVIAIAFGLATLLSRPRDAGRFARAPAPASRPAEQPPSTQTVPGQAPQPAVGEVEGPGAVTPDERSRAAVEAANRRIREFQDRQAMKSRDGQAPWPHDLEPGRDGVGPSAPGAPPGTRPGTFSSGPPGGETPIPTPRAPTQIDVSFRPPEQPVVGTTVYGVVELSARDSLPRVAVTAVGDEGLTIDKPGGTLYSGPLRAGETVRVPVPMTASKGGLHEIHVKVESDAPGASTDVKAFVPNFRSSAEAPTSPALPADKPVDLVFKNAPVRQALLDIAKQAGLRVEMAEGLGGERISQDVRGVPARAALRAVAEEGGYRVEEVGEVFRVTRAAARTGS